MSTEQSNAISRWTNGFFSLFDSLTQPVFPYYVRSILYLAKMMYSGDGAAWYDGDGNTLYFEDTKGRNDCERVEFETGWEWLLVTTATLFAVYLGTLIAVGLAPYSGLIGAFVFVFLAGVGLQAHDDSFSVEMVD